MHPKTSFRFLCVNAPLDVIISLLFKNIRWSLYCLFISENIFNLGQPYPISTSIWGGLLHLWARYFKTKKSKCGLFTTYLFSIIPQKQWLIGVQMIRFFGKKTEIFLDLHSVWILLFLYTSSKTLLVSITNLSTFDFPNPFVVFYTYSNHKLVRKHLRMLSLLSPISLRK